MSKTTNSLIKTLTFAVANPALYAKPFPGRTLEIVLAAVQARGAGYVNGVLGTTDSTQGVRRGTDGIAYVVVSHGEYGDIAHVALTDAEAAELGIPTLEQQQTTQSVAVAKADARAEADSRFLSELDR